MTERDEKLLEFATPRQAEKLNAYWNTGSDKRAAEVMGVTPRDIWGARKAVSAKAARAGYTPASDNMRHPIPEGYFVKRRSARFDKEGNPAGGWVISVPDAAAHEARLRAAIAAVTEDLPRLHPIPLPAGGRRSARLCNLFTITDYHVGMLAWEKEGGANWDLRTAEDTLVAAIAHLIDTAPKARVAVVNQLGDFLHFDGLEAVTPTNRHTLDADSRFRKVVQVAIRVLRRVIDMALASHDEVHVVMAEGNHDLASAAWLQALFATIYENEPRVTVNDAALPFYVYQHGRVMLGFHHGHMKRNDGLPAHFAASYPVIWGGTDYRYIHVGHRHHVEEKEHPGVKVVQHSTLAARDAYAARGGWHSQRQAVAITYDVLHGEIARNTVVPGMIAANDDVAEGEAAA